jgi:hypothetical protein
VPAPQAEAEPVVGGSDSGSVQLSSFFAQPETDEPSFFDAPTPPPSAFFAEQSEGEHSGSVFFAVAA